MADDTYFHSPHGPLVLAGDTTKGDVPGGCMTTYHSTQGMKKYRYLYNADTVSKAAGLPCCYVMSNTTYPTLAVDQPTTANNLEYFAGVFAETCTSGAWVWVQTWGYNSAAACRRYGSQESSNGLALDNLTVLDGVDALSTFDGVNSGVGLGPVHVWAFMAGAVRLASVASHGTSTTTSACPVFIRGYIP